MVYIKKSKHSFEFIKVIIILGSALILTQFKCIFKSLTGIPCPSCGLTRAYKSILHLNFKEAFYYHPLFWLIPPLLISLIYAEKPLFKNKIWQKLSLIASIILILSVYIYRMINLFPYTAPMDYDKSSVLYKIFSYIQSLLI